MGITIQTHLRSIYAGVTVGLPVAAGVASLLPGSILGRIAFPRLWVRMDLSDTQSFLPDGGWVLKGYEEQARNRGCGGGECWTEEGALEMLVTP